MSNPAEPEEKFHPFKVYLIGILAFIGGLLYIFRNEKGIFGGISGTEINLFSHFGKNLHHPLAVLLWQCAVILIISRIFTVLFRRIGQASVIGEITAGIALGPSLFGLFFPDTFRLIFPAESLGNLQILSQFGLIIFMFIVGIELDIATLRTKAHAAVLISHLSIVFPFLLGSALSIYLYPKFSLPKVSFLSFGLFMGIAMSVTAFPVLARILQEKGFARTQVGAIVITAAAIDDISAWIMLALIIAVIHSGGIIQSFALIGFVLLYAAGMIFVLRPFLNKLGKVYITKEYIGRGVMTFLVTIMMFSALTTEILGIHALFGAFLAGVIMPSDSKLRMTLRDKFEDFSAVVLLPLFFAYTGLRTQIGLISTTQDILDTVIIILAAVAGKFGGGMAAARFSGIGWRDSGIIGTLMNTRGLMELVVLNIGYDLGILSPKIFAMMVLMALVTTFMTSPVLDLFKRNGSTSDQHRPGNFPDLLITFGPPKSGEILFRLAHSIFGKTVHYSALHISPIPETISLDDPVNLKEENFSLIREAARKSDVQITPIFKMTNNTSLEIVNTIEKMDYSIVFMGGAKKIFGDNVLGGKVDDILSQVNTRMGIFLDRGFDKPESVLVMYKNPEEAEMLFEIAGGLQKNFTEEIHLLYDKGNVPEESILRKHFRKSIRVISSGKNSKKIITQYSLVIVGYSHWLEDYNGIMEKLLLDKNDGSPDSLSSILILRPETLS